MKNCYLIFLLLATSFNLSGQNNGMHISVSKPMSVINGKFYQGSIDIGNPTNQNLYLRVFDENATVITQELIPSGTSGATSFNFTSTNTAQYQLWIGFDQGFNNASFTVDNYVLTYEETVIQQVCSATDNYRYGFNGKEKDDEINGNGDSYHYGFRMYNPLLGRFLSIDPLVNSYPSLTTYQFAANNPIWAIDLDGLEALVIHRVIPLENGNLMLVIANDNTVKNNASVDFQLRIPAGVIPGVDHQQIFTRDDLGTQDFGYKEIQSQLGGQISLVDNNLYYKGKLSAYGVETFGSIEPGANLQDFILRIEVPSLTPNTRIDKITNIPVPFEMDTQGDFSASGGIQVFTFTAPESSDGLVTYNLNYDDYGVPNNIKIIGPTGNTIDSGTGSGSFVPFTLKSGETFTIEVTGDPSLGSGDAFEVTGSATKTESKSIIE